LKTFLLIWHSKYSTILSKYTLTDCFFGDFAILPTELVVKFSPKVISFNRLFGCSRTLFLSYTFYFIFLFIFDCSKMLFNFWIYFFMILYILIFSSLEAIPNCFHCHLFLLSFFFS